jgi:AraC family transcriptional regulator
MAGLQIKRLSMHQTVQDFLRRSPLARATHHLGLGEGCSVTIWENRDDHICYEAPRHHTFSLYLAGGNGTRRIDAGGISGRPGAVCVMPEGCGSEWEITTPFRFVHLNISDERLRAGFSQARDCDARLLEVREESFVDNAHVAAALTELADAARAGEHVWAETTLAGMVAGFAGGQPVLRGGLSPHVLRRIDDWLEAHLEDAVHLDDLARIAGMSGYHFHRMFRLSRGMAPHAWITAQRVKRAQNLLKGKMQIARISAACGFSSQSHMTRIFRHQTGLTPAGYRAIASSRTVEKSGALARQKQDHTPVPS